MFIDIRLTWKVEQILLKHARNNVFFALFDCLYIIESFKKIHEIAGFIPNPLRFHEKKLLKPELERIEAFWNTEQCHSECCFFIQKLVKSK